MNSQPITCDAADDSTEVVHHVVVERIEGLVVPRKCISCGSIVDIQLRRVETKAARFGLHFASLVGRSLHLPLCKDCYSRQWYRVRVPVLVSLLVFMAGSVAILCVLGDIAKPKLATTFGFVCTVFP